MKSLLNAIIVPVLALALSASTAAALPTVTDECADLVAQARHVDPGTLEMSAHVRWTCDPKLLGTGVAKMAVNGMHVATAQGWDGRSTLTLTAVVKADLPVEVCVTVAGRDTNGEPLRSAHACDLVSSLFVELPQPSPTRDLRVFAPASLR